MPITEKISYMDLKSMPPPLKLSELITSERNAITIKKNRVGTKTVPQKSITPPTETADVSSLHKEPVEESHLTEAEAGLPKLDLDQLHDLARDNEKRRIITPMEKLRQDQFITHTVEDSIADGARRGARKDCQTAYQGAGILAVIPLVFDTLTDKGCKWK